MYYVVICIIWNVHRHSAEKCADVNREYIVLFCCSQSGWQKLLVMEKSK